MMSVRTPIWAIGGVIAASTMLAVGAVLVASASSASADIITHGGVLSLIAAPGVLADDSMAPGDHIYWPVSAQLDAATPGMLSLQVLSSQPLATDPSGLRLELASCPDTWTIPSDPAQPPTCDGGAGTVIVPETALANISPSKHWNLGPMDAVSTMPMIATISLPAAVPVSLQGANATVNLGFTALGDTEHVSPTEPSTPHVLGYTGLDATGPLFLGLGLLLAGLVLGRLRVLSLRRSERAKS